MTKQVYSEEFDKCWEAFYAELKSFLSFQSISVDPEKTADCVACAEWLADYSRRLGFVAELLPTPTGKPVVFAERRGDPSLPTVLFYGHYDVQPADPLSSWNSPPFEPDFRDNHVYARGARDDKGQIMFFLQAIETLLKRQELRCTVKLLLEGEEECGSPGLAAILDDHKSRFASDILMVSDTDIRSIDEPAIVVGLRGIITVELKVRGPARDLHSGSHGGLAKNPALALVRALSSCFTEDGAIAIPGFYDGMAKPDKATLEQAQSSSLSDEQYKAQIGVPPTGGETGRSYAERMSFRPTIEINGMISGHTSVGGKSIIPTSASVKLSSRLVIGQDSHKCLQLIKDFIRKQIPSELGVEVIKEDAIGGAMLLSADQKVISQARTLLTELFGFCGLLWDGASIPIIGRLAEQSGATPLLVGFGLEENNMHAPNENFSIEQCKRGYVYSAMMLEAFSKPA
jgi:acetylornithine deacetylase/succinyl-diaminopimelate desuccinylase-like protein